MPNTPVRRVESYCMPPKKSAWRFENAKLPEHSPSKSQFVESEQGNNYNMGIMSNDSEMKPVDRMQLYPSVENFSRVKHQQIEDAPLDFSVKKINNTGKQSESMNYMSRRLEHYERNGSNMVNHVPMQMFYPTRTLNGHNSPTSPSNNSPPSHASSSSKDNDSVDMDCSQESVKSPLHPVVPCVNRMNEINRVNSPEHRSASRENSPVSQQSILEGMLKGQQQSNLGIPNGSAFGNVYGNGLGVFENQNLANSSPCVAMGAPVMHPANMLNMAQYFGYGYVEHPSPFMSGYMYKPPEAAMVDASTARKLKKKLDPFTDALKSCSVEELRKKLDALNGGNSLIAMNSDYAVLMKPSYTPQECNGRQFSNNSSPEPVQSAINNDVNNCITVSRSENGEIDNSVSSHQNDSNANINPNKKNGTATDIKAEENSQIVMNGVNNVASTSRADDSNDSIPNNTPETSDGRRRKATGDYRDDPNYRMKRAKNNMAARRSRESRRIKEELIRKTASALEQQNKVLLRDITSLRFTYDELQMKYFSLMKEYENVKIQNSVLAERLNQKRCGQCGSAFPNVSSPGL